MEPVIKNFGSFSVSDLYALYEDVYLSSDGLSEVFEDKYSDVESFEQDISTLRSLPGSIALAAEINGKPAAYVTVRPRPQARLRHTSDLSMGVAKSARGQGLGRQILQRGLEHAFSSPQIEIVYLMVRMDNLPAVRLYEKVGFEKVAVLSRDTKIDNVYYDGLLMRMFTVDTQPVC